MARTWSIAATGWGTLATRAGDGPPLADVLLRVVDACLYGVIGVAPFFFGGRHDLGRFVLVTLIAVCAVAWFVRQSLLTEAPWPRTIVYLILSLAAGMLVLQCMPLPHEWLARLAPHHAELLPLWSPGSTHAGNLGAWQTLSLMPHETMKSLAMLVSYSLLFIVVAGRISDSADVERVLNFVAVGAVVMTVFGIVQYFTSGGKFFWFYDHPHRSSTHTLSGPFINRNHFAHFLVLGIGPLAAAVLRALNVKTSTPVVVTFKPAQSIGTSAERIVVWGMAAALGLVTFGVLIACSRGGTIVLFVACAVLAAIYASRGVVDSRFAYGMIGMGVVLVGLLSMYGYDSLAKRLEGFTSGSMEEIDHDAMRRKIWTANVAAFESLWPSGAGAGSHREVLPAYLPESRPLEHTHAESSYLQVATENGIFGVVLLAAGICVCGSWCVRCWRHASDPAQIRSFGAAAAGIAASLVHSAVDFVWYIPACISVTIVLAACLLRQSQLSRASATHMPGVRMLPRRRWFELAAAALLVGGWSVYVYFGPAIAAVHWDRYLRASVANGKLTQQQIVDLIASQRNGDRQRHAGLNDTMLRQLEQAVRWDPHFARAHLRLAAKYIAQFELLQQTADNAMSLPQIRDAALASAFGSRAELDAWLQRAFGENAKLLHLAANEARAAAALCPLQGEAYLYLADLSFLDGGNAATARAYHDQALRVRPYDADVLFEVGERELFEGNPDAAMERWKQAFQRPGPHQLKIIYLLAGRIPAEAFLTTFEPDWRTLRQVWTRYRDIGQPADKDVLLKYAEEATEREFQSSRSLPRASVWLWQSTFYSDAERSDEALACLERAYACDPTLYNTRRALVDSLQSAGRFAEAESHVRWCLARKPGDKTLSRELMRITKHRLAERKLKKTS